MRTVFSLCFVFLLYLVMLMVISTEAVFPGSSPPAPQLLCSVEGIELSAGRAIRVSNLKRIPLRVLLSNSELPLEKMTIAPTSEISDAAQKPTVEIIANMLSNGEKINVPVKLKHVGSGQEYDTHTIYVSLEIPIERPKRKKNIVGYLQRIESESVKGKDVSEETLNLFRQRRNDMIGAFEKNYMENKVGIFEIVCKYSSDRSGFWNGQVQSDPILIQVVFEGKFFDQPNFRSKKSPPDSGTREGEQK